MIQISDSNLLFIRWELIPKKLVFFPQSHTAFRKIKTKHSQNLSYYGDSFKGRHLTNIWPVRIILLAIVIISVIHHWNKKQVGVIRINSRAHIKFITGLFYSLCWTWKTGSSSAGGSRGNTSSKQATWMKLERRLFFLPSTYISSLVSLSYDFNYVNCWPEQIDCRIFLQQKLIYLQSTELQFEIYGHGKPRANANTAREGECL